MPEEVKGSTGEAIPEKLEGATGSKTSEVYFPNTGENGYPKKKEEPINFSALLVKPHKKKSRPVEEKDLYIVIEDAHKLYNICHTQIGPIPGAFAMHHSQINDEDPMNFFVTADKEIVINPKIVRHTKTTIEKIEGCVSFPYNAPVRVERYNKIEVEFRSLTNEGKLSEIIKASFSGKEAQIWQHECDHGDGVLVYNLNAYEKN